MERIVYDFTPRIRELTPEEIVQREQVEAKLPEIRLQSVRVRKQLADKTRRRSNPNPSHLDYIFR